MATLMDFKNIAVAITLITFFSGIVGLLSNIGYRAILSSYPVFLEKSVKITSIFTQLGIVVLIVILNSIFYELSIVAYLLVICATIIYLIIQLIFLNTIKKIVDSNRGYKATGKKAIYAFSLSLLMLIIAFILFIFIKLVLYDNANLGASVIFLVILFLLIISGGYIPVLSYLNNLKKVTITYKEDGSPLIGIDCYWISQIDDWIVVKLETGEVHYLKRDRVIKMELEQ